MYMYIHINTHTHIHTFQANGDQIYQTKASMVKKKIKKKIKASVVRLSHVCVRICV
jgi:hypothetical protein